MDHLPELVHHPVQTKGAGTQRWDRHVTVGIPGLQLAGGTMETQM